MRKYFIYLLFLSNYAYSQSEFPFDLQLKPISISKFSGVHSFACAHFGPKWLIVGGRKDGVHARQPFNAFPSNLSNDSIFVIDSYNNEIWSKSINELSSNLREQLQSTNMNHYQDGNKLLLLGGYGFSATQNDHVTFPYLTIIAVENLINHIINNQDISDDFTQLTDEKFANTGGALNKLDSTFLIVGGHRFDGRYNPMNNPTFTQTYLDGIQKFTLTENNVAVFGDKITDQIHLHRRDYNLLSQFNNNEKSLVISSGVFQLYEDLPFLYPVEIKKDTYYPHTNFNQYLSNYHSGKTALYDQESNTNFTIFYGGISQYYYEGDNLISDQTVPFVKSISLLKNINGNFQEYKFNTDMPGLKGSGAHFFPNYNLNVLSDDVINFADLSADTTKIGFLLGGIESQSKSAFTDNQTNLTNSDASIYEVYLIRNPNASLMPVTKPDNFNVSLYPNPTKGEITLVYNLDKKSEMYFFISDVAGKIIDEGFLNKGKKGKNSSTISLLSSMRKGTYFITITKDSIYFETLKFILE
jgi:hypothetical protein